MASNSSKLSYDDLGRIVSVVFQSGARITYSYDQIGNRTSVVEVPRPAAPPAPKKP